MGPERGLNFEGFEPEFSLFSCVTQALSVQRSMSIPFAVLGRMECCLPVDKPGCEKKDAEDEKIKNNADRFHDLEVILLYER